MNKLLGLRKTFQQRVADWLMTCFTMEICRNREERNHRFLEESLELVQACGCTAHEAHQLVDYVFGRPVGDPKQEVGGAMNTLAALCNAHDFDMEECGNLELNRCWKNIEKIRAKQAKKPKHSPLPGYAGNRPDRLIIDDAQAEPSGLQTLKCHASAWTTRVNPQGRDLLELATTPVEIPGNPGQWYVQSIAEELDGSITVHAYDALDLHPKSYARGVEDARQSQEGI